MDTTFFILGLLLLVGGIAMRYTINRRRFYRRNPYGREQFKSYESAIGTRFFEKVVKAIGFLLILAGLFAFYVAYTLPHSNVKSLHRISSIGKVLEDNFKMEY